MSGNLTVLVAFGREESGVMRDVATMARFPSYLLLGDGEDIYSDDYVQKTVAGCDIVIVGMSDICHMEIVAADEAIRLQKPLALFSCGSLPIDEFQHIIPKADILFVDSSADKAKVQERFPTAKVEVARDEHVGGTEQKVVGALRGLVR